MPTMLENLELEEVSLVDKAANQHAQITLFKRDNSEEETMDEVIKMSDKMKERMKYYMEEKGMSREDAMKACQSEMEKAWDEAAEAETLKAEEAKLREENERLRKGLLDAGYVIKKDSIDKKDAEPDFIEVDGEQINKADVPAAILKRLEAAEIEKREAEIKKKADETLPNFKSEVAVTLMKFDLDEDTLAALKALDELLGEQMEEFGKKDVEADMADPQDKLNALAKQYAEEHEMTFAKAYSQVVKTDAGKELTKAIYKKDS